MPFIYRFNNFLKILFADINFDAIEYTENNIEVHVESLNEKLCGIEENRFDKVALINRLFKNINNKVKQDEYNAKDLKATEKQFKHVIGVMNKINDNNIIVSNEIGKIKNVIKGQNFIYKVSFISSKYVNNFNLDAKLI